MLECHPRADLEAVKVLRDHSAVVALHEQFKPDEATITATRARHISHLGASARASA